MEIKNFVPLQKKEPVIFSTTVWIKSKFHWQTDSQTTSFLLFVCCILGILFLVKTLGKAQAWLKSLPAYSIQIKTLSIQKVPDWLSPYTQEITAMEMGDKPISIFSPELTQKIALAYKKNPWVKEVVEVSKQYPNQIFVRLSLRRPVAWVICGEYHYLIDEEGIRLPGEYPTPVNGSLLPIISNIESDIPKAGEKWQDFSLLAGLEVIAELWKNGIFPSYSLKQISMDKKKDSNERRILLILSHSSYPIRIVWGDCSSLFFPYIPSSQKAEILRKFLQASLENPLDWREMVEVDIRFGYAIVRPTQRTRRNW